MLDRITDYLSGRLDLTRYFEKIYPLAEQIRREDTKYPAYYVANGQYEHIYIDHFDGMAYIRLNGKQRISRVENDKMDMASCNDKVKLIFPLRIVAAVPKSKATKDDAFTSERISKTIIANLITEGGDLKDDISSSRLTIFPDSVTFDSLEVLSDEYLNVESMKQINYRFSYHAIDITVTVEAKESCLNTECNERYAY